MIKNFKLDSLISSNEIKYIIRNLTTNNKENYGELNSINYLGFKMFLVQLSALIFSRPPKKFTTLTNVEQLQLLFDTFRDMTRANKQSTKIYDNPDYSGSVN